MVARADAALQSRVAAANIKAQRLMEALLCGSRPRATGKPGETSTVPLAGLKRECRVAPTRIATNKAEFAHYASVRLRKTNVPCFPGGVVPQGFLTPERPRAAGSPNSAG